MHKKKKNPMDLSNIFPKNNNNFSFDIESSFVSGASEKQKNNKLRLKKYHNARYIQLKSGSTEQFSPSEEKNIYGIYRIE